MRKILPMILLICLLVGCAASEPYAQQTVFCMDTVMDIQIWGKDCRQAMEAVVQLLQDLEKTWSATDEDSFLSALNRGEGRADSEQQALLDQALALRDRTGGAFDPQLGSVIALWGFYDDVHRVPGSQELEQAKLQKKWDLGAIVKGYAVSQIGKLLESYDVDRAMINLGGNVQTFGSKPEGQSWKVGIQNPAGGDALGVLALDGAMAVVTSGDYQRYFEKDGVRYHHILNPQTGYPADSGLRSVTVICGCISVGYPGYGRVFTFVR